MITIYGLPMSSCTCRVLTTLVEKGVTDYELVQIDLMHGAQRRPGSSHCRSVESRAIARVVADKFEGQGTPLYGSTPIDKALVEQWLEVESQNFNPAASGIIHERFRKPMMGQQPDEEVVQVNVERLGKVLDVYDAHLAKSKYLAGDFFSLADLSHLPYINFLIRLCKLGDVIFEGRPHFKAWWEDISARPAWTQVIAMAGEEMKLYEPK